MSDPELRMLAAFTARADLKRALLSTTTQLPAGTVVRVGDRHLLVDALLGCGLVGMVYRAQDQRTQQWVALKRARADVGFFHQSLEIEAQVAALLASDPDGFVLAAPILGADRRHLVKPLYEDETLQAMLLAETVSDAQREAIEVALRGAARLWHTRGLLLDLSPKNLCWSGAWTLLDTGPKTHTSSFCAVLDAPTWENYLAAVRAKLVSARSIPSVLSLEPAAEDAPLTPPVKPEDASPAFFVEHLWRWFPAPTSPPEVDFLVDRDPTSASRDFIFERTGDAPMRPASDVPSSLARTPIVELCARALDPVPDLDRPLDPRVVIDPSHAPFTLDFIARECAPLGFGKALRAAFDTDTPPDPTPTLRVRPYEHWSVLKTPSDTHEPEDIFCHAPLHVPVDCVRTFCTQHDHVYTTLPHLDTARRFCELLCVPSGVESDRAVLLVPGFRATTAAAMPLIESMIRTQADAALFCAVCCGVTNPWGDRLVTAGRWETPLLLSTIDYLIECFGVRRVTIVGASQGTIGALLAARLHPHVDQLILDSPISKPLAMPSFLAKCHERDPEALFALLREHHLPHAPFTLEVPQRDGLEVLALRRERDTFIDICGPLEVPETLFYSGSHAATLRHDTFQRGIPAACLEAIVEVLRRGV